MNFVLFGQNVSIVKIVVGIIVSLLIGLVLFGGIQRIGAFAEKLVPIMAFIYVMLSLVFLFTHYYVVDDAIAFSGDSMIDGRRIITAFKGGNAEEMQYKTLPKLMSLTDDLWVLPGHGEPFKKKDFKFEIYNV